MSGPSSSPAFIVLFMTLIVLDHVCFPCTLFNIPNNACMQSLMHTGSERSACAWCSHFYINNRNCGCVSSSLSWFWEFFLWSRRSVKRTVRFPFRQQHSCTAKHNKGLMQWRKWKRVAVRAWERSRAGTSAWPSSGGQPHENNAFELFRLLAFSLWYK